MNNMNGIGSYNSLQKSFYSNAAQSRKTAKADNKKPTVQKRRKTVPYS